MPGKFYVDRQCTDCDSCRTTAPATFGHDKATGTSCVVRQPQTPEEVAAAMDALRACGSDAIGCDGEEPAETGAEPAPARPPEPAGPSRVAVGLVVAAAIALLAYILYRMVS